ncbi:unnamed protein product, partial [Absidia cylindrospora]
MDYTLPYHHHHLQCLLSMLEGIQTISYWAQYSWEFVVPLSNETWSKPFVDEMHRQNKTRPRTINNSSKIQYIIKQTITGFGQWYHQTSRHNHV